MNDVTLPEKLVYNVTDLQEVIQAYSAYLPDREPSKVATNVLQFCYLGDSDNLEASDTEIEAWKDGHKDLYSVCVTLELFKIEEWNYESIS